MALHPFHARKTEERPEPETIALQIGCNNYKLPLVPMFGGTSRALLPQVRWREPYTKNDGPPQVAGSCPPGVPSRQRIYCVTWVQGRSASLVAWRTVCLCLYSIFQFSVFHLTDNVLRTFHFNVFRFYGATVLYIVLLSSLECVFHSNTCGFKSLSF